MNVCILLNAEIFMRDKLTYFLQLLDKKFYYNIIYTRVTILL